LPHGVDAEWVKQLVAEHLVTVTTKRGFQKLEWQKVRERNEALDCRVYARAAVWIAGADRWSEDKWRDLEDQVGPLPADNDDTQSNIEAGRLARSTPPSTKRQSDWLGPRGKWF
jgi:phage terminase large subunit GpA-like protein